MAREIAEAMERASAAILLVSADFLASDFIVTNELPPLLKKARSEGTQILPLILSNCRFERDPELSAFQAVNDLGRPLASLPSARARADITTRSQQTSKPRRVALGLDSPRPRWLHGVG